MAGKPRFSITIPAFNAQATLARTVESVRAQTFADWELVIVDDGSTDDTRAVAELFAARDARVRVASQENRGSGGAYNAAVRAARGDLLVMLSADDLLHPAHLASFDACIRSCPDAAVFTCGGWYEYDDGRVEAARPQARWSDLAGCTLEELVDACFYGVGAVYRRAVYDAVGGFREDVYAEDYLFWLLALARGFRHRHIDQPLSVHRRTGEQKSADAIRMRETDLSVIAEVMATGLLSPPQLTAARRSADRLRRHIRVRKTLARFIALSVLEDLIAHTRRLRGLQAARRLRAHQAAPRLRARMHVAVPRLRARLRHAARSLRVRMRRRSGPPAGVRRPSQPRPSSGLRPSYGPHLPGGLRPSCGPRPPDGPRSPSRPRPPAGVAVAFINSFPGPTLGGGEVQLLALLRGLVAADVRPTVVCAAGSGLEREALRLDGVVVPVDFALRCLPTLPSRLAARLADAQIVQGTGFLTNLIARRVGARTRIPVINTAHVLPGAARLDGETRRSAAVRALLDGASRGDVDRFVAVSEAVSAGLIADKVGASRITVIPNGVDALALRSAAPGARSAGALSAGILPVGPENVGRRVGYVGRLEQVKGCEFFVRAAALLAADHPDVRFVVAGVGSQARALRALAAEQGVADRMAFVGYVESPPLLAALDVLVVPSLSEASGLAAMEALVLGVAVVASRVGGLPEVVVDGETGLLVAPGDEGAIACATARLLDDPALARRLAAAGAQRVEERFALDRMVEGYRRLYRELAL